MTQMNPKAIPARVSSCCNDGPETAAISGCQLYVAMNRAEDKAHLFTGRYTQLGISVR